MIELKFDHDYILFFKFMGFKFMGFLIMVNIFFSIFLLTENLLSR